MNVDDGKVRGCPNTQGEFSMLLERRVPLLHKTGLHVRAAGSLAQTAGQFQSDITVTVVATGRTANAKSILEILTLEALPGVELSLEAEGDDADQALDALEELVRADFNEAP